MHQSLSSLSYISSRHAVVPQVGICRIGPAVPGELGLASLVSTICGTQGAGLYWHPGCSRWRLAWLQGVYMVP